MAKLRISYLGEPVLRAKAEPVADITDELLKLAHDMIETMLEEPGLGLAAPQVGVSRRLVVVRLVADSEEDEEEKEIRVQALLNPRLVETSEETFVRREGCLSLPTLYGDVERARAVLVRAVTLDGDEIEIEGEGLMARILQHEIDHLDGTVFLDRVDPETLVWLVPDEKEEAGYREEPTTAEEAKARFQRMIARRAAREKARQGGSPRAANK